LSVNFEEKEMKQVLSDDKICNLWLCRKNIHNGDLMLQLHDFARAIEAAVLASIVPTVGAKDERALFEADLRSKGATDYGLERWVRYPDEYSDRTVQAAWQGWRSRAALAQPSAAKDAPAAPAQSKKLCDRIVCLHAGQCVKDDAATWLRCPVAPQPTPD
jgi:hypothetical protein